MIPKYKREQPIILKGIALFFFILILFHFTITVLYNFIEAPSRPAFITAYVEPLFTQNFKIFAPDAPTQTTVLYIKHYSKSTGWSNWENPDLTNFSSFQNNRFSAKRSLHLIYLEAIHQLQYADAAVNYYVIKNHITTDSISKYRKEYLHKTTQLKGVKSLLNYYLGSAIKTESIQKVKCCLVTNTITIDLNQHGKSKLNTAYCFFEFELNPPTALP